VAKSRNGFHPLQHLSMGSPEALSDIITYTREVIDGRLSNGDLVVGNHQLVKEIQDVLIQGAQGMSVSFSANVFQFRLTPLGSSG
jgi:hypothetical protein